MFNGINIFKKGTKYKLVIINFIILK